MTSPAPKISVLIVAHEAGRHLGRCLEALGRQSFRDFEVLLLDNGSTDGAAEALPPTDFPLALVRSLGNIGFAAGNNLIAREARGEWLALLNPDAFAEPDWLAAFEEATRRYPDCDVFGSTQLLDGDPDRLDGAGDHYSPLGLAWRGDRLRPAALVTGDGEVMGPCAAAAFYRRSAFLAVGGFAARFFCYYEDVDLGLRLRLAGHRCIQLAGARVRHVGSATAGQGSDFSRYHVTRNRIWTFLRCMPAPLFALFLPVLAAQLLLVLALGPVRGDLAVRRRAIADAVAGWRETLAERRRIQKARRASLGDFARALTWSPLKLLTKSGDRRAVAPDPRFRGDDGASGAGSSAVGSAKAGTRPSPTGLDHAAE